MNIMGYFSIKGKAVTAAAAVFVLVVAQLQTAALAADQPSFDYFVLALKWPGSPCKNIEHCCPEKACCQGAKSPTQFTIHGLWPEYVCGGWPECCTDQKFNPNEISALRNILSEIWPSYDCGSKKSCNNEKKSHWAAQYEKHGTCTASVIGNQYDYFSTAISLFNTHNVTKALEDGGFVASNDQKYPLRDVMATIWFAFNGIPNIKCDENGIIDEVWLCFDKNLKQRNCVLKDQSCPSSVSLPTYVPWVPVGEGATS